MPVLILHRSWESYEKGAALQCEISIWKSTEHEAAIVFPAALDSVCKLIVDRYAGPKLVLILRGRALLAQG